MKKSKKVEVVAKEVKPMAWCIKVKECKKSDTDGIMLFGSSKLLSDSDIVLCVEDIIDGFTRVTMVKNRYGEMKKGIIIWEKPEVFVKKGKKANG